MISIVLKILTATSMIYRVRIQCMSEQFPHMAPSMIPEAELGVAGGRGGQSIYWNHHPTISSFMDPTWTQLQLLQTSEELSKRLNPTQSQWSYTDPFWDKEGPWKPSHGYASPPKLHCREVLSAVASNFKASEMMFPPTLGNKHLNSKHHICGFHPPIMHHISYIIYIYIHPIFSHSIIHYIYSIHPPTDQIKNHNGTFSVQAKVLQLEPLLRQMWWGTNPPFAGTRDGIYDIQYQDLCDIPRCCTS
jgi:hypothetical protein